MRSAPEHVYRGPTRPRMGPKTTRTRLDLRPKVTGDNYTINKDRIEESKLWSEHKSSPSIKTRNNIIEFHLPLVRWIATRYKEKLPANVTIGEIFSYGVGGLIDAIKKFDPSKGALFSTFCERRVRGAMVDGLRKDDWVPRLVRNSEKTINAARSRMREILKTDPTDEQLAEHLEMTIEELDELIRAAKVNVMVNTGTLWASQTNALPSDDFEGSDQGYFPAVDVNFFKNLDEDDLIRLLRVYLTSRDRRILFLYYFKGKTFGQIGEALGRSESRICQIHTRALKLLREALKPYYFEQERQP